jgi:triosephosphate isomerase
MKQYLYAANWKMYLPMQEEILFFTSHKQEFTELSTQASIALFPSYLSLPAIAQELQGSSIKLGAQDCSAAPLGAYTGQVSARSIAQVGCTYCIVGHSERRALGETNDIIAQKVTRLLENSVTPIVCIGETAQENAQGVTLTILEMQLEPILKVISDKPLVIAYEPVWAIGTNRTPTSTDIEKILLHIATMTAHHKNITLLYGGSIDKDNIKEFKNNAHIGGFLIGHASMDSQEFKKIVQS